MRNLISAILATLLYSQGYINNQALELSENLKKPPTGESAIILDSQTETTPKSIILIIADGAGIGQYTISYYANERFSPSRFQHIGLVATHPDDGYNKVPDSASLLSFEVRGFCRPPCLLRY